MHHCCGNATAFVPLMIEEGVDWWQADHGAVKDNIEEAIHKYGDQILFDVYPGYSVLMPEDDEEFKAKAAEHYRNLAGTGHSSLAIVNMAERSFDVRKYCYQLARKTYEP